MDKVSDSIHVALQLPTLNGIGKCIFAVNSILNSAVKMHCRKVDKSFIHFATSACAGGASLGHKLVKVFEKDATLSYETEHNTMLKELGATIGMRMDSRIVNWAIGK